MKKINLNSKKGLVTQCSVYVLASSSLLLSPQYVRAEGTAPACAPYVQVDPQAEDQGQAVVKAVQEVGAAVEADSEAAKKARTLQAVLKETISSEQSYVKQLAVITKDIFPLLRNEKILNLLESEDREFILNLTQTPSSIDKILGAGLALSSMKTDQPQDLSTVVDHINKTVSAATAGYHSYVPLHERLVEILGQIQRKKAGKEAFSEFRLDPAHKGLDVASYLILPVQRLPRYELLLKEVRKNAPESEVDNITTAISKTKSVASVMNELVRAEHTRSPKGREERRQADKIAWHEAEQKQPAYVARINRMLESDTDFQAELANASKKRQTDAEAIAFSAALSGKLKAGATKATPELNAAQLAEQMQMTRQKALYLAAARIKQLEKAGNVSTVFKNKKALENRAEIRSLKLEMLRILSERETFGEAGQKFQQENAVSAKTKADALDKGISDKRAELQVKGHLNAVEWAGKKFQKDSARKDAAQTKMDKLDIRSESQSVGRLKVLGQVQKAGQEFQKNAARTGAFKAGDEARSQSAIDLALQELRQQGVVRFGQPINVKSVSAKTTQAVKNPAQEKIDLLTEHVVNLANNSQDLVDESNKLEEMQMHYKKAEREYKQNHGSKWFFNSDKRKSKAELAELSKKVAEQEKVVKWTRSEFKKSREKDFLAIQNLGQEIQKLGQDVGIENNNFLNWVKGELRK